MSTIRLTTPILLAALAAALCNKAGVLNLAIEGEMLLGSFVAIVVTYCLNKYTPLGVVNPTLSTYLGVVVSILFGGVLGVLMAWLHTKWGVDLVIFSIAFNMLASEITSF
jgi:simple sugar transport system permease protein